jgi:hypothetical protein
MKAKEIENYVRQYAPVSLVLEINKGSDVLNPVGFDALLDGDSLALSTTLGQISRFIESESPNAKPKWIRDGRVLSDSLNMADLISDKDLHPNRTGGSFDHQIELLCSKVTSATTFNDIDSIYKLTIKLCKQFRGHQDVMSVVDILQQDGFFDGSFTETQRESVKRLCQGMESREKE